MTSVPDPEAAARGDIPEAYGQTLAVAMSPDGDTAATARPRTRDRQRHYLYAVGVTARTGSGTVLASCGCARRSHLDTVDSCTPT